MERYANSKMRTIYAYATDETNSIWDSTCKVEIDGDYISVKYQNPDYGKGFYENYTGRDQGHGHYTLSFRNNEKSIIGDATLHRLGQILVGWWNVNEDGELSEGAWKIELRK